MPHNTFGHLFRGTTFGESLGPAIGGVIDGCPPLIPLEVQDIQLFLDQRPKLFLAAAHLGRGAPLCVPVPRARKKAQIMATSFPMRAADCQKDILSARSYSSHARPLRVAMSIYPAQSYQNVSRETFWYDWHSAARRAGCLASA
ncbi:MAG: chorismate synthase [Terriglobales bacterium]